MPFCIPPLYVFSVWFLYGFYVSSMAADRQQVERMEAHHTQLIAENKLRFPPAQGRMVIFTVYEHAYRLTNTLTADTLEATDREARRIQRYLR